MKSGIQIFQTPQTECPYLDGQNSSNYIVDPAFEITPLIYDFLLEKGFRRSASIVYRPACPECKACKSTRVPVGQFVPNRSQKRAWSRVKGDISIVPKSAEFDQTHFELYKKYTGSRHADSEMAQSSKTQYMDFLTSGWSNTLFLEIRLGKVLLAVAVTDRQPNSLSALYTFYDPQKSQLSPGVLAILSQIDLARQYQLDWLYLGYWISDCAKMAYKTQYQPIQYLESEHWHLLER